MKHLIVTLSLYYTNLKHFFEISEKSLQHFAASVRLDSNIMRLNDIFLFELFPLQRTR